MRFFPHFPIWVALAGAAGCTPAAPPRIAVPPAAVSEGTILSMRPVFTRASDDPLRMVLFADGTRPSDNRQSLVEFIVRADDGATLSIVQPNGPGFHPGDRAVILHGDDTHLARPG